MLDANCICTGTPITHDAAFAYSNIAYCTNSSDPIPWIAELGGVFSVDPIGLAIDTLTGEIDLDMSTPNSYYVSYTVGGTCPYSSTQQVAISAPPNASWIHPGPICVTQGPQDLNLLVTGDAGGVWQGDGMMGSVFDPTVGLGTYELTYTVILGACTASVSQTVLVNPGPYAEAGPDTAVCGLAAQVHAVLLQAGGVWSGPPSLAISNPSDPSAWVTAPIPGTYTLLWTVGTAPCIATDSIHITFHDPNEPIWVSAGDDQYLAVFTATQLHGQGSDGATFLWTVITGTGSPTDPSDVASDITGLSMGENTLVLTASIDGCGFTTDTVTITVQDLFIPQGFSPNGDGVNDRFEITGIEAYPGSDLKVFDRWGRPVMAQKDYDNSWDGRARNGVPLLDDTYFYVLNLSEGLTYNGYLIIKR
ncbi:MAG: gliding motility-associated C-terminal domain-containing protein [Flavobacteriales bacterium]|nr:gliding motility-associated C-terminal domain-containing protein [Flavobacteriales bacterium]